MPSPLLAPLIMAGSSLLGQGLSAFSQGSMNRRTRKWNEMMYNRQRQDALSDWNMQNLYDSPISQMRRLQEAGLNPHLVYGSGADATSDNVRSSSAPAWNPSAVDFDFRGVGNSIMDYYDIRLKEAQTNNVNAATKVSEQDRLLKMAQAGSVLTGTEKAQFELDLSKALRLNTIEIAETSLEKLKRESDVLLRRDEREAAMNSSNLKEAAERILTMRLGRAKTNDERDEIKSRIRLLDKDVRLRELDIKLREMGINPNDPMYMRMLGQYLLPVTEEWKKLPEGGKDVIRQFFKTPRIY